MQFTLCTSLYALHSMHFTLCTSLYALHSMHFTLCTSLYALHSMHFTLCTSLYALHSMHFTLCTSLYALHSMHFSLCCCVRGLRTEEPFAMLSGIKNIPKHNPVQVQVLTVSFGITRTCEAACIAFAKGLSCQKVPGLLKKLHINPLGLLPIIYRLLNPKP